MARPIGEHLLLASGERAGDLVETLLKPREQGEDLVEAPLERCLRPSARIGAEQQVLAHAHLAGTGRGLPSP